MSLGSAPKNLHRRGPNEAFYQPVIELNLKCSSIICYNKVSSPKFILVLNDSSTTTSQIQKNLWHFLVPSNVKCQCNVVVEELNIPKKVL